MGHSTASGRTGTGSSALTAEMRDALRNVAIQNRSDEYAQDARRQLREYNQRMRSDAEMLDDIYASRNDDETPEQTVARFEQMVGVERATNTIASLVNRHASDGRISRTNRSWASEQSGALRDRENRGVIDTRMHMAHLNQVADAMRHRNDDRAFQSASRAAAQRAREVRGVGNDNFGQQVLRRNNRRR